MKNIADKIYSFLRTKRNLSILIAILILALIVWSRASGSSKKASYQTAQAEKGTLVVSLSESGQVAVANRVGITTSASGMVDEVFVQNEQVVSSGDKIASISLDSSGQQRQAQAWSSYLLAKSSLESAKAQLFSLQSTMFSKWKTYSDIATNSTYQNGDGSPNTSSRVLTPFAIAQDDWLAAEAVYKNQQNTIAQNQAALNSAWLSYQSSSSVITAPMGGVISDLIITPGMQIGSVGQASSGITGSAASSQSVASIKTEGNPVLTVSLSEADAVKVRSGQKATVIFDAIPGKTFSGRVLGINTTGSVSSGVTTYPATVVLDLQNEQILPNMSATVNIVTDVRDNVLLVPSGAIQTPNGQSTVRVLRNGNVASTPVEIGEASDSQTEITSGLNEGDTVVVSFVPPGQSGASPFSGGFRLGGGGGFGGGRGGR